MRVAQTRRDLAMCEKVLCEVRERGKRAINQRHVDKLSFTGAFAVMKRRQYSDRGVQACDNVTERHPTFIGGPSGSPVTPINPPIACAIKS